MSPRANILNSRTTLVGLAAVAGLMAVMPSRLTWWTRDLSAPVNFMTLPVSWLVKQVVSVARPGGGGGGGGDGSGQAAAHLRRERDELLALNLRVSEENARLREQIAKLNALPVGLGVGGAGGGGGASDTRRIIAPVFAADAAGGASILMVRTGGVRDSTGATIAVGPGDVAVHEGVNLVGRVIGARGGVADIRVMTDPSAGVIRGSIYPDELDPQALRAGTPDALALGTQLIGIAGGRLRGVVYALRLPEGRLEPDVRVGMTVRLSDPSWPRAAQMLVIGTVERVERADNGRPIVIVRPGFEPQSLQEVTIMLTTEAMGGVLDAGGRRP